MKTTKCEVTREKYWHELDANGRDERLRTVIRQHENTINDLKKSVNALLNEFGKHQHNDEGTVLVPSEIGYGSQRDSFQWFEKRMQSHTGNPNDVYI